MACFGQPTSLKELRHKARDLINTLTELVYSPDVLDLDRNPGKINNNTYTILTSASGDRSTSNKDTSLLAVELTIRFAFLMRPQVAGESTLDYADDVLDKVQKKLMSDPEFIYREIYWIETTEQELVENYMTCTMKFGINAYIDHITRT